MPIGGVAGRVGLAHQERGCGAGGLKPTRRETKVFYAGLAQANVVAVPNYRRNFLAGGTYFFTVNLRHRGSDLLTMHIGALRGAVRAARVRQPFRIDAWVVLPDHMHCLWTLPDGDADFPGRWQAIKAGFSRCVVTHRVQVPSLARRRERGVWQRRYWEHTIRDARDYANHMDYIHFNPVKRGLVDHPGVWPFSMFRRCVARGLYPADWDGAGGGLENAGERVG